MKHIKQSEFHVFMNGVEFPLNIGGQLVYDGFPMHVKEQLDAVIRENDLYNSDFCACVRCLESSECRDAATQIELPIFNTVIDKNVHKLYLNFKMSPDNPLQCHKYPQNASLQSCPMRLALGKCTDARMRRLIGTILYPDVYKAHRR